MPADLFIPEVCERDIDLLLLEEFLSSDAFCAWFVRETTGDGVRFARRLDARRSVTTSSGESDLEFTFASESGERVRMLIENKIGAGFQPRQRERYAERGEEYVERGECERCVCVLVAPRSYFGAGTDAKGFDGSLTYESIAEWFASAENLGARRVFKEGMLGRAIERGTLGYQRIEDEGVSRFWAGYWAIAREFAPDLEMRQPGGVPAGSSFVYFHPAGLTRGMGLCHKMTFGAVDLQIRGAGARANELRERIKSRLTDGLRVERVRGSAAIRLEVAKIRVTGEAEAQRGAIEEALRAAQRLAAWARENGGLIEEWGRG